MLGCWDRVSVCWYTGRGCNVEVGYTCWAIGVGLLRYFIEVIEGVWSFGVGSIGMS